MTEIPTGWPLLHAKLPSAAIKELATDVYGVAGLSDVNEGYLIQRLFASGFAWEWRIRKQEYLGFEDKTTRGTKDKPGYPYRVYMAAVHGRLQIQDEKGWRVFDGSGASDNRKLDAAYKGAATVAFKNACKLAGLTAELYLDGRAIDHIYSERVRKDQDMVAEVKLEQRIQENLEAFPLPQAAQDSPTALPVAAPDAAPKTNGAETAPPEPAVPSDDDLADLYALARTLKTPATAMQVRNQVAETSIDAVRRRLILAHAEPRNCGRANCEHVKALVPA